jgi:hypothetical protein
MEHYSAIKNEFILLAEKWMEPETIMSSEISQAQKDNYHMFSLMQNLDIKNTHDMIIKGGLFGWGGPVGKG